MQSIISWIKSNKITAVLILIVAFLVLRPRRLLLNANLERGMLGAAPPTFTDSSLSRSESAKYDIGIPTPVPGTNTPHPEVEERMKVRNASISLHVKDVRKTINAIETYAESVGGYIINQSVRTPEGSESGSISLRVPTEKLDETLAYFRENSVNVVSETISGHDITDAYVDTQARLQTLEKTKTIFENMREEAKDFDNILRAQKEILNVQSQIDDVKGQIAYMEGTAKTALVRVQLSTDALELGYTPKNAWRPGVVFKRAVRSLVANLRGLGNTAIWLAVYGVIWVPVVIIVLVLIKRKKGTRAKGK